MRSKQAVDENTDVEAQIAQIEQMKLDEITAFTSKMMAARLSGKVTPKEARAIDRAVGKRLNVIEEELRKVG